MLALWAAIGVLGGATEEVVGNAGPPPGLRVRRKTREELHAEIRAEAQSYQDYLKAVTDAARPPKPPVVEVDDSDVRNVLLLA